MTELHTIIEARQESFEKESSCWDIASSVRPLITEHTRETIRLILEAQCALWEGRKKRCSACEPDSQDTCHTIECMTLSEIIASNRELLANLQS